MRKELSAIGPWCLLLGWMGLITSCVRDDWDMRAAAQDTALRVEIQTASTAEIQQFSKENRLLSTANGASYSVIQHVKMSNRNAAAGGVFYQEGGYRVR